MPTLDPTPTPTPITYTTVSFRAPTKLRTSTPAAWVVVEVTPAVDGVAEGDVGLAAVLSAAAAAGLELVTLEAYALDHGSFVAVLARTRSGADDS